MSFLPSTVVENIDENGQQEYIDFLLDKNTMKFTIIGTEEESIKNWVEWAIKISRYKYPIFPYNYGNELYDELIGKTLSDEELKDLVEYCIIDCLQVFQWIDKVDIVDVKRDGKKVYCKIVIKTIYGMEIEDEFNI